MLTAYRIGDADGRYPIFDATGSTLSPGRWKVSAGPMIDASEHYSTAMLEKLALGSGRLSRNRHYVTITIPNGLSYEVVNTAALLGWDSLLAGPPSQRHGDKWQRRRRSLVLIVPSVVTRVEDNILINPNHPEFRHFTSSPHQPVWWDERLFRAEAR